MGMYDEIRCLYPLPNNPPAFVLEAGHTFQTKDLACDLTTYEITADGAIDGDPVTLELVMYSSNIAGSGPGLYTTNGEDAESVEYAVKLIDGRVVEIRETSRDREPALPISAMHGPAAPAPTPEEKAAWKLREAEHLTGRTIFVMYGEEYLAEVVADGTRRICVRKPDGDLELLYRADRDRIFWDSEAEAKAYRDERNRDWDARKKAYDELVAARQGSK